MAKLTVADCVQIIQGLEARLDTAARCMADTRKRIATLEEQDTKTRKQLWYLQKIAKGEFSIGSQAAKEDTVIEAEHLSF